MLKVSGILRGNKRKTDNVAVRSRQHHPPVCQGLACRTISCILPQYSLNFTLVSNSCISKGVGLCLPQSIPNLMLCCLKPAQTTSYPYALVLCLALFACLYAKVGGTSNDRERTRTSSQAPLNLFLESPRRKTKLNQTDSQEANNKNSSEIKKISEQQPGGKNHEC